MRLSVLMFCLLAGCSGERTQGFGGGDDPSSVDSDGSTEDPAGDDGDGGLGLPAGRGPRQVSLEAAGGDASSVQHRMRFRVVAPIMVAGGRLRSTAGGAQ